ncbi:MAG: MFS transporter [Candidatus Nezhaarchaeota archaeon]|nr:MFS transporter [Candidatus Nezhaarchaeota archaeon]
MSTLKVRSREYLVLCTSGFAIMFAYGVVNALLSLYSKELVESMLLVGLPVLALWLVRACLEIPIGIVSNVISKRRLMILGILTSSSSYLLLSLTTDIWQVTATRMLAALGAVSFFVATISYISEQAASHVRGKAFGTLQAVESCALTSGASLGGYLGGLIGFRLTFAVTGFTLLATAISAMISGVMKNHEVACKSSVSRTKIALQARNISKVIKFKDMKIASLAIFGANIIEVGMTMVLPIYAKYALNMELMDVGLMMGLRGLSVALGAVIVSILFDKLEAKLRILSYIISFLCAITATSSIALTKSTALFLVFASITALSYGISSSTTPIFVVSSVPRHLIGVATGIWRAFWDVGGFASPIILGVVTDVVGIMYSFHSLSAISFLILLGILTLWFSDQLSRTILKRLREICGGEFIKPRKLRSTLRQIFKIYLIILYMVVVSLKKRDATHSFKS